MKSFLKFESQNLNFLRSTQKSAQSSSCFGYLLSKRPKHEEDFFQTLCVSQKVQTSIKRYFKLPGVFSSSSSLSRLSEATSLLQGPPSLDFLTFSPSSLTSSPSSLGSGSSSSLSVSIFRFV